MNNSTLNKNNGVYSTQLMKKDTLLTFESLVYLPNERKKKDNLGKDVFRELLKITPL